MTMQSVQIASIDAPAAPGSGHAGSAARIAKKPFARALLLPSIFGIVALALHRLLPNRQTDIPTHLYPRLLLVLTGIGLIGLLLQLFRGRAAGPAVAENAQVDAKRFSLPGLAGWFARNAALFAGAIGALCAWDLLTLKLAVVPLPFFPGPDMILQTMRDDWQLISKCAWYSLVLLGSGYLLGAILGIISGVFIGWSSGWRYWGMPVLKIIGPMPATAFIPLALMLFPNAFVAAAALIALAVWFPVTMLTTSGVANVRKPLLDVARTLGAGPAYLIFRVAIPAAMPNIFVGLFMGLGTSFIVLNVAETVGVPAGLGWYINFAKEYADYPKVYAALVIMAVFFSGIMTLLFKVRDRVLIYQKGTLKW